ncbi:hypothetical protein AAU61_10485 [Desulfocarbo indianensis]|nr:hypothetical protein AAU61_10485 [Desulfocarbo indianensis]
MQNDNLAAGMDPALRQALSAMHYGLYFLATGSLRKPQGMLVSWVSQVSGYPPKIMAAVRENREVLSSLEARAAYALCLLPGKDRELYRLLARKADERFIGLGLQQGPLELPVPQGCLAALGCAIENVYRPGDHVLMVGRVMGAKIFAEGSALSVNEIGHTYLGLS